MHTKLSLKKAIRYTLIFMFFMEMQIAFIIQKEPGNFVGVIILYSLLALLNTYISSKVCRITSITKRFVIQYLTVGLLGLFCFEWLLGNDPTHLPSIWAQLTMLSWWAAMGYLPHIFSEKDIVFSSLKQKIYLRYIAYGVISTAGASLATTDGAKMAWVILPAGVFWLTLNFSYWSYYKLSTQVKVVEEKVEA